MVKKEPKTIPVGMIVVRGIQWIFTIYFAVMGLLSLMLILEMPLYALFIGGGWLITAFLIFPDCNKILIKYFNVRISTAARITLSIILIIIIFSLMDI